MKFVVYGPEQRVGVLRDETVVDVSRAAAKYLSERQSERHAEQVAEAYAPSDLGRFIEAGPRALDLTQKAIDYLFAETHNQLGTRGEKIINIASEVVLHAPMPRGARIACAGGNFADHAGAMAARSRGPDVAPPSEDYAASIRKMGIWGFWKITRDCPGPEGELLYPARCNRLDYEGELAVVIGKKGKDISARDAKDYIWGITLLGDWSVRGVAEPGPLRFAIQKNFDSCCSLGPCIAVGEGDAFNAPVETYVNGERRQNFSTRDMVFSFAEYLEHLSRDLTFYPGDIIAGGTAAGTAADSSPLNPDGTVSTQRFLKPGDTVEVKNPIIGTLRTRVVAKRNA